MEINAANIFELLISTREFIWAGKILFWLWALSIPLLGFIFLIDSGRLFLTQRFLLRVWNIFITIGLISYSISVLNNWLENRATFNIFENVIILFLCFTFFSLIFSFIQFLLHHSPGKHFQFSEELIDKENLFKGDLAKLNRSVDLAQKRIRIAREHLEKISEVEELQFVKTLDAPDQEYSKFIKFPHGVGLFVNTFYKYDIFKSSSSGILIFRMYKKDKNDLHFDPTTFLELIDEDRITTMHHGITSEESTVIRNKFFAQLDECKDGVIVGIDEFITVLISILQEEEELIEEVEDRKSKTQASFSTFVFNNLFYLLGPRFNYYTPVSILGKLSVLLIAIYRFIFLGVFLSILIHPN